jgi:hypothetical protein
LEEILLPNVHRRLSPRGKVAGTWDWPLNLVAKLRMRGVSPPLPKYVFMAWCLPLPLCLFMAFQLFVLEAVVRGEKSWLSTWLLSSDPVLISFSPHFRKPWKFTRPLCTAFHCVIVIQ